MKFSLHRWMEFAVAILIGNILYAAISPYLPACLQHQVFRIDPGLATDFLLCVTAYLVLRRWLFRPR